MRDKFGEFGDDRPASRGEAVREWAYNVGETVPEQEYLLSDYDTFEKNPWYVGPPGRHPEDEAYDVDPDEIWEFPHGPEGIDWDRVSDAMADARAEEQDAPVWAGMVLDGPTDDDIPF